MCRVERIAAVNKMLFTTRTCFSLLASCSYGLIASALRRTCVRACMFVCWPKRGACCFPHAIMAISHDDSSLGAVAESSAAAFGAWVHEKLGRSDVVVSCVRPAVG